MRVVTFLEAETPDALRYQVRQMQQQAWPRVVGRAAVTLGPIHDPALRPLSMLLVDGDKVLSALDLLFKDIEHAGQKLSAAGLSSVVTSSVHRRSGYGRALVTRARAAMPALDVDLGLFTCDRSLGPFYEACGWELLSGTVLVGGTSEEPFPSDQPGFDKVTLGSCFTPTAIQVRESLLTARVMLYSGVIDKLW